MEIIRYAVPEDIPGMGRVYVDTWKAAYRGMIPEEYLHSLTYEGWEEKYRSRYAIQEGYHLAVLDLDGRIIGVSSFMKARDEDLPETFGEIVSIYVLPEYWHMGYGRRLLGFAAAEMKEFGFDGCALWTLEDNLRAQKAYERFGFSRDGARKSYAFSGTPVWEIRYRKAL